MKPQKKIQRRWLLPASMRSALDTMPCKRYRIQQGYLGQNLETRVRVIDDLLTGDQNCDLTQLSGTGMTRLINESLPIEATIAYVLLNSTPYVVRKTRQVLTNGWKIDHPDQPLHSMIVVEIDMDREDQEVTLPPEFIGAQEVTTRLTTRQLAVLAAKARTELVEFEDVAVVPKRIALTGAPCAGKTSITDILRKEIGDKVLFVPEAATLVIKKVMQAFPPGHHPLRMRIFQHGLYQVQLGFEDITVSQAALDGKAALIFDRGTMDNEAYMPGGRDEFRALTGLSPEEHYARYDGVIYLAPPPEAVFQKNRTNNESRSETDYGQVLDLGERIRQAWAMHPNFHYVDGNSWDDKVENARVALRLLAPELYA